jgi:hypothetical protein
MRFSFKQKYPWLEKLPLFGMAACLFFGGLACSKDKLGFNPQKDSLEVISQQHDETWGFHGR